MMASKEIIHRFEDGGLVYTENDGNIIVTCGPDEEADYDMVFTRTEALDLAAAITKHFEGGE